mmetsp:Transcript_18202/g.43806  ORF Transcript_18202/g.43806 Transcript_18202/m.43806 type:complete len:82 (+) Transcript_18202:152-397(+)
MHRCMTDTARHIHPFPDILVPTAGQLHEVTDSARRVKTARRMSRHIHTQKQQTHTRRVMTQESTCVAHVPPPRQADSQQRH